MSEMLGNQLIVFHQQVGLHSVNRSTQINSSLPMAKCFGELSIVKKTSTVKDFTCVAYVENGNKVVAGNTDGLVRVYNSSTLTAVATLGTATAREDIPSVPVTDISCMPKRNEKFQSFILATYTNGYVKLWNIDKGVAVTTLDEGRQTLGLTFSSLQPNFVTVGDDAAIYLYDEQTMSVIQTLKSSNTQGRTDGHTSRVFTACFHPKHPNEFVTGGWDNTVQFWDMRKPNSVRFITGPHICGRGIDFCPVTGKEFITASYNKENPLQKWDYSTGKLLVNFEADIFRCMLYTCRWFTAEYLGTGGTDPSLFRTMHIGTNSTIGYFRSQQTGVYSIDYKDVTKWKDEFQKKHEKEEEIPIIRNVICTGRFVLELDANLVNR